MKSTINDQCHPSTSTPNIRRNHGTNHANESISSNGPHEPAIANLSIPLIPNQNELLQAHEPPLMINHPHAQRLNNEKLAQTTGSKMTRYNRDQKYKHIKTNRGNQSFTHESLAKPLIRNFDKILKKSSNVENDFGTTAFFSPKPKRLLHDVFNKVDRIEPPSSLVFLKQRLNGKIKVTIRRRRNCPFISRVIDYKGTLTMFDKHMNLYMRDVIESFVYKTDDDRLIKRARHRDDILLRGDNIIVVS